MPCLSYCTLLAHRQCPWGEFCCTTMLSHAVHRSLAHMHENMLTDATYSHSRNMTDEEVADVEMNSKGEEEEVLTEQTETQASEAVGSSSLVGEEDGEVHGRQTGRGVPIVLGWVESVAVQQGGFDVAVAEVAGACTTVPFRPAIAVEVSAWTQVAGLLPHLPERSTHWVLNRTRRLLLPSVVNRDLPWPRAPPRECSPFAASQGQCLLPLWLVEQSHPSLPWQARRELHRQEHAHGKS